MDGNGRESDGPPSHTPDGKFAPGNKCSKGGQLGAPNRGAWIKEQIQATCSEEALAKLKAMSMSDNIKDLEVYWRIVGRTIPQELHAQISPADSIADAATAAAKRAAIDGNGRMKTEL